MKAVTPAVGPICTPRRNAYVEKPRQLQRARWSRWRTTRIRGSGWWPPRKSTSAPGAGRRTMIRSATPS